MNPALPARLRIALDGLLEGVSRKDLAARAQAISKLYRGGSGSALAVTDELDTLAYVVARLPATYAVALAVLEQARGSVPDFAPRSLLDAGAGPATASWAAREVWPDIARLTLTDSNPHFLGLARKLSPAADANFLSADLSRDGLPQADLVIAGFVLAEIPAAARRGVVERLYAAATDVLVLVEPGTPDGFARIRAARDTLIASGAGVLGPCTHAQSCPIVAPDWCHFSQRLPRSRDHMHVKGASVPYEDERYAWLAVSRARGSAFEGKARVLAPPKETKPGIELKLCTPSGLENRFIAKRDADAFRRVRKAEWGDVV
ncbi:MAG: small ribosomal subunit Rsm22 family protein [Rhizomicrobium sp.]